MIGPRTATLLSASMAAWLLSPNTAAAEACGTTDPGLANIESPLVADPERPSEPVPIDASPWVVARCATPDLPFVCAFESDAAGEPAIEVAAVGLDRACADPDHDHVVRMRPSALLQPAQSYTLRCASTPLEAGWLGGNSVGGPSYSPVDGLPLATQASADPSAPPIAITGSTAELRRQDDTCCGEPLTLVVDVPKGDGADRFTREGGVVEVVVEGDVWVIGPGRGHDLPWTERGITLTAVAADGTRGEPLEIPPEAIDEELIYTDFGCALRRRVSPLALWLLAPLVLLRLGTRRARRRRGTTRS